MTTVHTGGESRAFATPSSPARRRALPMKRRRSSFRIAGCDLSPQIAAHGPHRRNRHCSSAAACTHRCGAFGPACGAFDPSRFDDRGWRPRRDDRDRALTTVEHSLPRPTANGDTRSGGTDRRRTVSRWSRRPRTGAKSGVGRGQVVRGRPARRTRGTDSRSPQWMVAGWEVSASRPGGETAAVVIGGRTSVASVGSVSRRVGRTPHTTIRNAYLLSRTSRAVRRSVDQRSNERSAGRGAKEQDFMRR
jgi:hypothetical protein